jgi:ATP-dependent RNA helicase RhlE
LPYTFSELQLAEPLLRALQVEKYLAPTPIQIQAIPHLLGRRDLLGLAQTGTGKTAAFALPILQLLAQTPAPKGRGPRALILTPTRELALQILDSFRAYGRFLSLRSAAVFGGVGQKPQVDALARGLDILVATPGRLLDLTGQGHVRYDRLSFFVLDEADRMLDMGFLRDVRKIIAALPKERQTLLFSATMPKDIASLADAMLKQPVRVEVSPVASTVELVEQRVIFVAGADKPALLTAILKDPAVVRTLVFARTKHGADRIATRLARDGIGASVIHGNKSQGARQRALNDFRAGGLRVLVATDIAARGIDIDDVSHVINFDIPNVPESYVHRIGRTARAGASGIALSFCDPAERTYLRDIERLTKLPLSVIDHPSAGRNDVSSAPAARGKQFAAPGTNGVKSRRGHPGRSGDESARRRSNSGLPHRGREEPQSWRSGVTS